MSAAFSPIMIDGALVLPLVSVGSWMVAITHNHGAYKMAVTIHAPINHRKPVPHPQPTSATFAGSLC